MWKSKLKYISYKHVSEIVAQTVKNRKMVKDMLKIKDREVIAGKSEPTQQQCNNSRFCCCRCCFGSLLPATTSLSLILHFQHVPDHLSIFNCLSNSFLNFHFMYFYFNVEFIQLTFMYMLRRTVICFILWKHHLHHSPTSPVYRKMVFHEISPWCQKYWGLLLYRALKGFWFVSFLNKNIKKYIWLMSALNNWIVVSFLCPLLFDK